jgi:amino acid transporter
MVQHASRAQGRGLKEETLSKTETLAQSIGNIAPTATPALVIPLVFGLTGNATWLAYLVATIGILFVARNVNYFARETASPGSLYSYITAGLGSWAGLLAGWALLAAYAGTGAAVTGGFANYVNVLLKDLFGFEAPIAILVAFAVIVSWLFAHRDIQLSTRTTLALELASVGLILVILVATLLTVPSVIDPHQLSLEGLNADGLRLGLVLAFFSFVGFESAASLGAEARDPLKSIPSAILRSSLFVGLFFIFSSYVLVLGFHGQPEALDKSGAPLHVLAEGAGLGVLKHWIDLGAAISFLACTLASINAGARILFQLGRHGFFHNAVGNTHEINKTPHVAAGLIAIATLIPPVALALLGTAPFDIFGWTGSFASYGFIVAYVLISLAAAAHLGRHKRLTAGALVSVAGAIIVLVIALAGNLYPVPPAPLNWLPYAFLAYLALGVLWFGALKLVWPTVAEEVRRDVEAEAATLEKSIA